MNRNSDNKSQSDLPSGYTDWTYDDAMIDETRPLLGDEGLSLRTLSMLASSFQISPKSTFILHVDVVNQWLQM